MALFFGGLFNKQTEIVGCAARDRAFVVDLCVHRAEQKDKVFTRFRDRVDLVVFPFCFGHISGGGVSVACENGFHFFCAGKMPLLRDAAVDRVLEQKNGEHNERHAPCDNGFGCNRVFRIAEGESEEKRKE